MLELDDELVSFLDKNLFDKVTPNTGQFDDSFLKALFRDDYVTYVGKYITTKSPIVPISNDYYKASVYSEKGFFGRLAAIYDPILNFESLKSAFGISLWVYFFVMMFGGALLEVKFIPSVNAYISLGKLQMLNLLSICVVNLIIAGILLTIGSYFTKKKKVIE